MSDFDLAIVGAPDKTLRAATDGRGMWELPLPIFVDDFENEDLRLWSLARP